MQYLTPVPLPNDSRLLIAAGVFTFVMVMLSIMGLLIELRFRKLEAHAADADRLQRQALAAPYTPDFTTEQLRTAANTNSRRAIARDSQKGTTHE